MLLADSHSHIFAEEFDADTEDMMLRAIDAGVKRIIMPNIDCSTIKRVESTNRKYPEITRMAIGLHPESVNESYQNELKAIKAYIEEEKNNPALVAIGEIGLDYYWDTTYKTEQIDALKQQFEWAIHYNLPVIIHTRAAHKDMVDLVSKYHSKGLRGVFHSFTGSQQELRELLPFSSFMIGINGIATFKKSDDIREMIKEIPLDRLLLETDAPYLAPVPKRGKRNEPAYILYTATTIAQTLGIELEELAKITYHNCIQLFDR